MRHFGKKTVKGLKRGVSATKAALLVSLSVFALSAAPAFAADDDDKKQSDTKTAKQQVEQEKADKLTDDKSDLSLSDKRKAKSDADDKRLTLTKPADALRNPLDINRIDGTLNHLRLSLRDTGAGVASDAESLLSLKEVEDTGIRVSGDSFVGFNSLSGMLATSRGAPAAGAVSVGVSEVGLSLGSERQLDGTVKQGLEVALQTAFAISNAALGDTRTLPGSGLEERDINLGLRVGYSGFNLDASLIQHSTAFNQDGTGFEAGLSYETGGFLARFSARQYREGLDLSGFENEFRSLVSFEFGARYRLSDGVGFTGGFRMSRYDDHWLANPALGENSRMVYLGGSLRF